MTLDFEGQGTKTTVVYGRFKDTFSSGSQGVVLLNIVFHENPPVIKKGDYGVVILPTGPAGKPTLLVAGEVISSSGRAVPIRSIAGLRTARRMESTWESSPLRASCISGKGGASPFAPTSTTLDTAMHYMFDELED
ncbi:MAG: hypothetical protein ABI810_06835 [Sphingomonas bacterium]